MGLFMDNAAPHRGGVFAAQHLHGRHKVLLALILRELLILPIHEDLRSRSSYRYVIIQF